MRRIGAERLTQWFARFLVAMSCCLLSVTSAWHYNCTVVDNPPQEPQFWGMPEMVAAASTGSIQFKGDAAIHFHEENCPHPMTTPYRTFDGTCNNVFNWGSVNQKVPRLLPSAYDDSVNTPRSRDGQGFPLPSPTDISRHVHSASDVNEGFTVMLMQWGQFLDHDLDGFPVSSGDHGSIKCCGKHGQIRHRLPHKDCNPILLGPEDSDRRFVGECMEFTRSAPARDKTGHQIYPREQMNTITAFIDGSTIYGTDLDMQRKLREPGRKFGSLGFRLRMSEGDLLPPNPEPVESCMCEQDKGEFCFLAGDKRVNEHPGLSCVHTLFARLHNRIAESLKSVRYHASDEEIFQEARKLVGAVIQNIHYGEWLPLILGKKGMRRFGLRTGSRSGYLPNVDPRVTNEFATATFRFGHTMIPDGLFINGRLKTFSEIFNRPGEIFRDLNSVVSSLISPSMREGAMVVDRFISRELTDKLFAKSHHGNGKPNDGLDLIALNIQRGRDHGLPPYNKYRHFCGLTPLKSFQDLNSEVGESMRKSYRHVDDIDLFTGLMCEERKEGQLVGPTLACLLGIQFHALKYGDRFFFETDALPEGFTDNQLKAIRKITMAHVMCLTDLQFVQKNAFQIPSKINPMLKCSKLRRKFLDFSLWGTDTYH